MLKIEEILFEFYLSKSVEDNGDVEIEERSKVLQDNVNKQNRRDQYHCQAGKTHYSCDLEA